MLRNTIDRWTPISRVLQDIHSCLASWVIISNHLHRLNSLYIFVRSYSLWCFHIYSTIWQLDTIRHITEKTTPQYYDFCCVSQTCHTIREKSTWKPNPETVTPHDKCHSLYNRIKKALFLPPHSYKERSSKFLTCTSQPHPNTRRHKSLGCHTIKNWPGF